jgi:hypothetical protein
VAEPEPAVTGTDPASDATAEAREQAKAVLALVQGFAGADTGVEGDCAWCPICRAARALRDGRPEVAEHLTDAVSAALQAVKALNAALDSAAQPVEKDSARAN